MRDARHAYSDTHLHLALIAWLQISWEEGVPWVFTTVVRTTRKTILKTKSGWWMGICTVQMYNPLKIHSFSPYHTDCLFCPWAQPRLLFTEDIATGICACWQSIGGFERKAVALFGEYGLVCLSLSHASECSWPYFVQFYVVSILKGIWSIFR